LGVFGRRAFQGRARPLVPVRGPLVANGPDLESFGLLMFTKREALALIERLRADGKTVVFTNGVFDLLHPGHVRYLRDARRLGDVLIVGVNSDRSVRANKGADRPLTPEAERAEILVALECVDAAVIFDEDTPHDLISTLQPDVLVKGADWGENAVVGRDIVEARGGKVVRIPIEFGYSTSGIVETIRSSRRT
jgi:D-glycero-beta-D-manno-heptose 1-phosphate adenylyltransferase